MHLFSNTEEKTHIVAISGGKDSVAMSLLLKEEYPQKYLYLYTPTGDELPEMKEHMENIKSLLGGEWPLLETDCTLKSLIYEFKMLPRHTARWCTRILKIEPALEYMRGILNPILYVGLRADEPKREGIYGKNITTVYPLRAAGMGKTEVLKYLCERKITIPGRTDCARCYEQRLIDWWRLWKNYPKIYADAMNDENTIGKTFRGPKKDNHPTALKDLKTLFENGWIPEYRKAVERTCKTCSM